MIRFILLDQLVVDLFNNIHMYGFTTSQTIEIVVIIASVILYYCALSYAQQNVWSFFFSVSLICLIVDILFMNDTTFDYEPHYENWQRKQEVDV